MKKLAITILSLSYFLTFSNSNFATSKKINIDLKSNTITIDYKDDYSYKTFEKCNPLFNKIIEFETNLPAKELITLIEDYLDCIYSDEYPEKKAIDPLASSTSCPWYCWLNPPHSIAACAAAGKCHAK